MIIEHNEATYRRFIHEVFDEGRLDALDALLSPSHVLHDAPPGAPPGPAAVAAIVAMFRAAFPDLAMTIDELVAEGDLVCARATTRGTHRGPLFGLSPTGRSAAMTGLTMVRVVEGRLVESWVRNDVSGLMRQLGD